MIKNPAKSLLIIGTTLLSTFSPSLSNAEESIVRIKKNEKQANFYIENPHYSSNQGISLVRDKNQPEEGLEEAINTEEKEVFSSDFNKGKTSIELVLGFIDSNCGLGPATPGFEEYSKIDLRYGLMHNDPVIDELFAINQQFLLEITYSDLHDAYGSYLFGLTPLLRYNFIKKDSKQSYYVQFGFGAVLTDAYKVSDQEAIGKSWEFTPQAAMAIMYKLNDSFSLIFELTFHHVSNGWTAERNDGTNGLGSSIGFKYNTDIFSDFLPNM